MWYVPFIYNIVIRCMIQNFKTTNRKFCHMHSLLRRNAICSQSQWAPPVGYLLGRHLICCLRVKQANREILSESLCISVLHLIPSNAILLTSLLTGRAQYEEVVLFLLMIISQILFVPILLFLPAYLSSSAHEAICHLLPIQWAIPNSISLKVKLDAHYDRLIGKQSYGFTIGSLGLVTYRNIFEVNQNKKG